jgi:hypothetical protein
LLITRINDWLLNSLINILEKNRYNLYVVPIWGRHMACIWMCFDIWILRPQRVLRSQRSYKYYFFQFLFNKALNFLFITYSLLFEHVCFRRFRAFTQHNVIIKNMTWQWILLFSHWNNTFVIFTVKITECEDIDFIQSFIVENVINFVI